VNYRHYIITRYNVKLEGRALPTDRWFRQRWVLFERYTVRSVLKQINQNFVWLVLFQRGTQVPAYRGFVPLFVDDDWLTGLRGYLERVAAGCDVLVTSRLDNDDLLAPGYVENIQRAIKWPVGYYLDYTCGYQIAGGRVYDLRERCNPFVTYVETGRETVYRCPHGRAIYDEDNVVKTLQGRGWAQLIHGENISNRLRGRERTGRSWARDYV
jgi:hypothetical protein